MWEECGWMVEVGSCILLFVVVVGMESYGKFIVDCEIKEEWVDLIF